MSVFPALEIKTLVFVGENSVTFQRYNVTSFVFSLNITVNITRNYKKYLKSARKDVTGNQFVLILQRCLREK